MNTLAYYLSRIYYSLIAAAYPGYDGQSDDYWAQKIYYAVSGQSVTTYADGRDASFFIEKWYRHLIGQPTFPPQGGLDSAVWLQKIWGYYAFGAPDTLYDGRSAEFWASMILATNPTLISPVPPPTISDGGFSVSDAEPIGYDVGTPTFTGTGVTFAITAGNAAGKFSINAATGLIELAATLNWWNLNFLTGGSTYALTVQVTNAGGSDSATITVTVTSPYENGIQFLKMNETAGTDALDYSTVNPGAGTRDAVYNGVTLNATTNPGGIAAPLGDGINDFVNLYSAALNTALNGQQLTFSCWFKAFDAAFWSGTTVKTIAHLQSNGSNQIEIGKYNVANTIYVTYIAGGTTKTLTYAIGAITEWFNLVFVADKAGDLAVLYTDAVLRDTETGLGTWTGTFNSTNVCMLSYSTSGNFPAKGYVSYYRLYNVALPASHIAKLANEFTA